VAVALFTYDTRDSSNGGSVGRTTGALPLPSLRRLSLWVPSRRGDAVAMPLRRTSGDPRRVSVFVMSIFWGHALPNGFSHPLTRGQGGRPGLAQLSRVDKACPADTRGESMIGVKRTILAGAFDAFLGV
jgi:hypothetical protein